MMLTRSYYEKLEALLEDNAADTEKEIANLQNEFLYEAVQLYAQNEKDELDTELRAFKRFKKMLSRYISHSLSYQIGMLTGVVQAVDFLAHHLATIRNTEIKMDVLFRKEINKKILFYLYDHPSSQHKIIAEAVGAKPNYLSQQMRELEQAGGIVRYGVDRRSFYELTLNGQAFVEKKKNQQDIYFERILEEIRQEEKWEYLSVGQFDPMEYNSLSPKFAFNKEKTFAQKVLL